MMNPEIVMFSGGLQNKPDPVLIQSLTTGKLVAADDAMYLPGDQALHRVAGRSLFGDTSALQTVIGIHHLSFQSGDGVVLVRTREYLYEADEGETGTFNEVTTSTTLQSSSIPTTAVHHSNKFYLFDGRNNQVATQTLTSDPVAGSRSTRRHGLAAVVTAPTVAINASAPDGLSALNTTSPNIYWFWCTEYDGVNDVEGAFEGTPEPITYTTATDGIDISPPPAVNPTATAFRIYYSTTPTSSNSPYVAPSLATGVLIATVDVEVGTYTWSDAETSTAFISPQSDSGGWSTGATPNDGSGAYAEDGTPADGSLGDVHTWYNFTTGITSDNEPIKGILVRMKLRELLSNETSQLRARVEVSWDGGTSWSLARHTPYMNSPTPTYRWFEVGGPKTLWEHSDWTATQLDTTNFRVRLTVVGLDTLGTNELKLDHLKVKIYHSGADDDGRASRYETIVIQSPGSTNSEPYSRDSEPPVATTGTIFQDCLVTNDVENPRWLRYSVPGEPDSFPTPYVVTLETDRSDEIVAMVGREDRLVVGMKKHIVRVQTLPLGTDFDFNQGRVWSIVTTRLGVAGPRAMIPIQADGTTRTVLFIDPVQGPYATNGYECWPVASGLDWEAMVNPSLIEQCQFVDYPKYAQVILYYAAKGSSKINARLIMHYDQNHVGEDGRSMKVTGPCNLPNGGAAGQMTISGAVSHLYGDDVGRVYVEDRGTDPSPATFSFRAATGDIYHSGIGNEDTINRASIHARSRSGNGSLTVSAFHDNDGECSDVVEFSGAVRGEFDVDAIGGTASKRRYEITSTDAGAKFSVNFLAVYPVDRGER